MQVRQARDREAGNPLCAIAGRVGDGYHSSVSSPDQYAARLPVVGAAAEAAGRPMHWLSARARVEFDTESTGYAMRGTPEQIAAEVRAFAEIGVTHLALWFGTTDPGDLAARAERFSREVEPLLAGG